MPKSKSDGHDIEQLTVRFPKGLLDILRESAEENDRSLNAEIVNAARSRIKAYEAQKGTHALVHSQTD